MNENKIKLSETLWEQRTEILVLRKPKWVLKPIWSIPAFTGLVLLTSEGFRLISIFLIIGASIFVVYSIFTYFVWKNWESEGEQTKRFSIIVIMIYDGILLGTISILCIAGSNLSLRWIDPLWIKWGGIFSLSLYLLLSVFILFSGKRIVKYLIEKHDKPLPPQTKLAMTIQGYIVGVGIALGAIFKSSQFGLILVSGLGYLGAYLLLPFVITAFYQVYLMIRDI
jgi:predicted MFS family arabinose efflux permease